MEGVPRTAIHYIPTPRASLKAQRLLKSQNINPLNAELNPICHLFALLVHHFLHVSRI